MQMAVIEAARNLAGIPEANSTEFGDCKEPVVSLLTEWMRGNRVEQRDADDEKGGTMRLGSYPCRVEPGSQIADIYGGEREINERHRHRFGVNVNYRQRLEDAGMWFSGMSPDKRLPETSSCGITPGISVSNSTRVKIKAICTSSASPVLLVPPSTRRASLDRETRMQEQKRVEIGSVFVANDLPLTLIAGPCALESRSALEMSQALCEMTERLGIGFIYKSSFDKANRTSNRSPRGLGITDHTDLCRNPRGEGMPGAEPEQCTRRRSG